MNFVLFFINSINIIDFVFQYFNHSFYFSSWNIILILWFFFTLNFLFVWTFYHIFKHFCYRNFAPDRSWNKIIRNLPKISWIIFVTWQTNTLSLFYTIKMIMIIRLDLNKWLSHNAIQTRDLPERFGIFNKYSKVFFSFQIFSPVILGVRYSSVPPTRQRAFL